MSTASASKRALCIRHSDLREIQPIASLGGDKDNGHCNPSCTASICEALHESHARGIDAKDIPLFSIVLWDRRAHRSACGEALVVDAGGAQVVQAAGAERAVRAEDVARDQDVQHSIAQELQGANRVVLNFAVMAMHKDS